MMVTCGGGVVCSMFGCDSCGCCGRSGGVELEEEMLVGPPRIPGGVVGTKSPNGCGSGSPGRSVDVTGSGKCWRSCAC